MVRIGPFTVNITGRIYLYNRQMTRSVRHYSGLDRLISALDEGLRAVNTGKFPPHRPNPADTVKEQPLSTPERRRSAALMRVNHAGEVSAQALYLGQGMTARDQQVRGTLQQSAREEVDHLVWCEQRLQQLGSHTSYLNPLWYLGSFSLGALAGVLGDKWSLGFLAETEHQVVRHLDQHLQRLPENDRRSRAIVRQMRQDESRHATVAIDSGALDLPLPVQRMMGICSRVMTTTAYWV
jgi:ubiquinone biosynthesis monooxygenase Coq7